MLQEHRKFVATITSFPYDLGGNTFVLGDAETIVPFTNMHSMCRAILHNLIDSEGDAGNGRSGYDESN